MGMVGANMIDHLIHREHIRSTARCEDVPIAVGMGLHRINPHVSDRAAPMLARAPDRPDELGENQIVELDSVHRIAIVR
jgi:hypothetical protein